MRNAVELAAARAETPDPPRNPVGYVRKVAVHDIARTGPRPPPGAGATPAERKRLDQYRAFVRDFRAPARGLRFVAGADGAVGVVGPDGGPVRLSGTETYDVTVLFAPLIRADLERGGQPGTV